MRANTVKRKITIKIMLSAITNDTSPNSLALVTRSYSTNSLFHDSSTALVTRGSMTMSHHW